MSLDQSDFIDDIVQDSLPVHTEPPRDVFLPWHRVRKEYIRRFQWNELAVRLIKNKWRRHLHIEPLWSLKESTATNNTEPQIPDGVFLERALACLVIPGDDLLDIRALWRDVQSLNCLIRYLGFNESHGSNQKGTRIHIANNDVTSLPNIWKGSCVIQDRFEAIAGANSQAHRYLKEHGPYHIVNLDLCGSLFPNTANDCQKYYDALNRLFEYQFEFQKTEWLLFISTMVEPGVVHAERFQMLCGPTHENYHKYSDFAAQITKLIPAEVFLGEGPALNISSLDEDKMMCLFGVAFGKWLIKLCQQAQPQWTVAMRRSYSYGINEDKKAVMMSFAFEMRPNTAPPVDTTGMSSLVLRSKKFPSELECALAMAESVANIRNVDHELTANPTLKIELQEAQASLLESAGFDRAEYLKWVSEGEITSDRKF